MVDVIIRQEKLKFRQEFILEKVIKLIINQGIDDFSMADVCRETGLGAAQIYRCFKDKNTMLEHLIMEITHKRIRKFLLHQCDFNHTAEQLATTKIDNLNDDELKLITEFLRLNRNSELHRLVVMADELLMNCGLELIHQRFKNTTLNEQRAISEAIATLTEGMLIRTYKGLNHQADPEMMQRIYQAFFNSLDNLFTYHSNGDNG
ncbi:TetR/AcrR family transcriptional regulator [Acinetobacter qingfengensis]|uniref:HTH tetR-type domain-containing protein n=1 Tax=Acinetobacter qingfengensis TaxID=1262585 RepID=A0A1E7R9L2_9GAMM|nr:TetR/AcrR family transcriptional regulator [Acinetobacter qingfengensis]KAA8735419.1 TetR/AcrR family transcriptional regulator [Acinetobacter qingfengensis]OEY95933.1 hypothetical protein BJI46_03185 [Acinetobacter qingfengensis]